MVYHPRPNGRKTTMLPALTILKNDKAIQLYLARHKRDDGTNAHKTESHAVCAAYHFLNYLKLPITDHAIYDLVQQKRANPADRILEDNLSIFQTLKGVTYHRQLTASLLGIFHKNYARVELTIHIKSSHKTQPIKEGILRSIYGDPALTDLHKAAIDLMNYGAERIEALSLIPLNQVELIENTAYAILNITNTRAKTGIAHPCIIPKKLAEYLLENAQKNGYTVLLPEAITLWRQITKLAKEKYHVRLTSHYLRKRFESLAEQIPQDKMNCNHWLYLMGSAGKLGHLPDIYGLKAVETIIKEYDRYLAPRLSLTDDNTEAPILDEKDSQIAKLTEQVKRLTTIIERLTAKPTA